MYKDEDNPKTLYAAERHFSCPGVQYHQTDHSSYVQAGDLGIYKSFKDKISPTFDAWKNSDEVKKIPYGNPKPPEMEKEVFYRWVNQEWR